MCLIVSITWLPLQTLLAAHFSPKFQKKKGRKGRKQSPSTRTQFNLFLNYWQQIKLVFKHFVFCICILHYKINRYIFLCKSKSSFRLGGRGGGGTIPQGTRITKIINWIKLGADWLFLFVFLSYYYYISQSSVPLV